jgi:hypothetical protein
MPQDPKDVIGDFIVETIEMLKKEGYDQMYFIDGSRVLGEDFEETTVDGSHPTDLGFYNMAKILYPVLAKEK